MVTARDIEGELIGVGNRYDSGHRGPGTLSQAGHDLLWEIRKDMRAAGAADDFEVEYASVLLLDQLRQSPSAPFRPVKFCGTTMSFDNLEAARRKWEPMIKAALR